MDFYCYLGTFQEAHYEEQHEDKTANGRNEVN